MWLENGDGWPHAIAILGLHKFRFFMHGIGENKDGNREGRLWGKAGIVFVGAVRV